jgi:hypothetical protein
MKKVNVLVTAASRRVPLVRAFRSAVERFGRGRVVTTDMNPMSPALYFGHKHYIVPLTADRNYIPIIEGICDAEDVGLIIPTIDDELPIFGRSLANSSVPESMLQFPASTPAGFATTSTRHICSAEKTASKLL